MSYIDPIFACDFYKVGHKAMYPVGTEVIYSNFTPRSNRLAPTVADKTIDNVVFFGLQGFVKNFLIETFNEKFFKQDKEKVVAKYKKRCDISLGAGVVDVQHIADLHDLGYLPIEIKALPEGSLVPVKVPVLTIKNTKPEFFWLTNYLETVLSDELWKPTTTATIAFEYRKMLTDYAIKTGSPVDFVLWQAHDFSLRGQSNLHDAASCAGHLVSFLGSDTIPSYDFLEAYYDAENTFIGGSVPATEHSVMCAGGKINERETFKRLITEVVPTGLVSIVSDTWDFWAVMTEIAPSLKQEILDRKPNDLGLAKVVFRPDSGDPADILCGTSRELGADTPEQKGAVELLWDTFGGTVTDKGFKVLNERIGLIYGDSITLERANDIMQRLMQKGFASCNVVFGVGSFTYQYVTRDTFGFAMKATYSVCNGEGIELFKDPITDNGVKKSAKGLLRVEQENGSFVLHDQQTPEQEKFGCLQTVFVDGQLVNETTLVEIRERVAKSL